VDRIEGCAHQEFLCDFIPVYLRTRPKSSNKLPKRYLEGGLSAQQITDELGVSKQFVLTQLRIAGIRKTPRRGRSGWNSSVDKSRPELNANKTLNPLRIFKL
jgi:hypothetical protein